MRQHCAGGISKFAWILDPICMHAGCLRHRGKIGIVQVDTEVQKSDAFISSSTKPSVPLLNTTILTGSFSWIAVRIRPSAW